MNSAPLILTDLRKRGFRVRVEGARLMVLPASKLTEDDMEAIAGCRDDLYRLATNDPPGLPDMEIVVMWPDGTIANKTIGLWDDGAGWWRHRDEQLWHAIPGRSFPKPPRNPRWQALGYGWYFADEATPENAACS